jgi:hypothetical protein
LEESSTEKSGDAKNLPCPGVNDKTPGKERKIKRREEVDLWEVLMQ